MKASKNLFEKIKNIKKKNQSKKLKDYWTKMMKLLSIRVAYQVLLLLNR